MSTGESARHSTRGRDDDPALRDRLEATGEQVTRPASERRGVRHEIMPHSLLRAHRRPHPRSRVRPRRPSE
jgi:hypothetical protein